MKVIAFYLPQFHRIKENDDWWGEGFTEWTNVRKARALFQGHRQPRTPLKENYYNLLDKNIRQWQGKLAKKYNVYGFCYYHYWFNGKLLLEKPLEMMLEDGEPDLPYCFSWANEPWTRTWDGKKHSILMNQVYGGKEDWRNHFYYLLKFFKNKNYMKIGNKPVLLIYRLDQIPDYKLMISYWTDLARKNGFDGIYISQIMNSFYDRFLDGVDARVLLEPMNTVNFHIPFASIRSLIGKVKVFSIKTFYRSTMKVPETLLNRLDYDFTWKRIINRKIMNFDVPIFPGGFVDWDNTPRRGPTGLSFVGTTPDKFYFYLSKLIDKTRKEYKTDMIFINAWNEWAEGTYLEPDTDNMYEYLESIKKALDLCSN